MHKKWEELTRKPLLISGILFLIVYAVPIIWPMSSAQTRQVCSIAQAVIWLVYVIDYVVSLAIAPERLSWFKKNLFNLFAVALPVVRPLRAIRAVVTLALVTQKHTSENRRGSLLISVGTTAFATWLVAGLAVADAERGQSEANIHSVIDGWWWAITTLTTVGYGDKFPVSNTGRMVGVAVMVVGIGLFGTLTAGLASYFVSVFEEEQEETRSIIGEDKVVLQQILTELQALNAKSGSDMGSKSGEINQTSLI